MDMVVVGGGVLGLAAARAWLVRRPAGRLVLIEKERQLAAHQTGHNSGVMHSGLYYTPGTERAQNCRRGKALLEAFCAARGVPFARVGKLVVATDESQLVALAALEERGRAHGVELTRVDSAGIRRIEPAAGGVAALHLPETGIVDYRAVARALADELRERGAELRLGTAVRRLRSRAAGTAVELELESGGRLSADRALVCCGLQADRMARASGIEPGRAESPGAPGADLPSSAGADAPIAAGRPALRTVPFLGMYFDLKPEYAAQIRGLIYPVPDPRFPFLGIHLTRRMGQDGHPGRVDAGPNAALAFAREGYGAKAGGRFALRDAASALSWPGTWRLLRGHSRMAAAELVRSLSRRAFAKAAARLVPGLSPSWLEPGTPGVRAQALGRDGTLVDDYVFAKDGAVLHVLNAPSPAATASLAIAEALVRRV